MLRKSKFCVAALLSLVMILALCSSAFAATVGQQLLVEEAGWTRYDDTNPNFIYDSAVQSDTTSSAYNHTISLCKGSGNLNKDIVKFGFFGTSLRIIMTSQTINKGATFEIKIDGNAETFTTGFTKSVWQTVVYEKLELVNTVHHVSIKMLEESSSITNDFLFDAVDVNETGYLVDISTLTAPINLNATAKSSQIDLSWDGITYGTQYNVKRSTEAGGPYNTIGTYASEFYTDTDVAPGVKYYYVVSAINDSGESENSNEVSVIAQSIVLDKVNDLTAAPGDALVNLSWSAVDGAIEYVVKRSATPGGPYLTVASNVYGTAYIDTNVTNGIAYYYVVTAVNADGESANSNEASATPQGPVVQPDTGRAILTITLDTGLEKEFDLSMNEVNSFISWYEEKAAGSGTASYAIDKHDNNKGPFKSRKDYIIFDKILTFEVNEYEVTE